MIRMRNFLTYLFVCMSAFFISSCSGKVDDGMNVPEGVLRIFADKTEILADGNETVTFKVMFGSRDVSNEKTMQLVRRYGDSDDGKLMTYGANSYSTSTPGTYTFSAEYYYGGKHVSDNSVKVQAKEFFTGEEQDFEGRLLCMSFTSTTCNSCPGAAANIKDLLRKHPDAFSVVSVHRYLSAPDPMETEHTDDLIAAVGGFKGLPAIYFNMDKDTEVLNGDVETAYNEYLTSYEPFCGIDLQTEYDSQTRQLTVDLGVTSNLPAVFRYYVFLVEDGIDEHEQCGEPYVHDNVLRDLLTSAYGDKINGDLPLSTGVEVRASKTAVLDPSWDVENMRVIAAAATSMDNGRSFVVNNVQECSIL